VSERASSSIQATDPGEERLCRDEPQGPREPSQPKAATGAGIG